MTTSKNYEDMLPKSENQIPIENYLISLKHDERHFLADLFRTILYNGEKYFLEVAALAVGTTTYKGDYWNGLKRYLEKNDPEKLSYVDRRGEDIDIKFCHDQFWDLSPEAFEVGLRRIKNLLDKNKIEYSFSEKKENGTKYFQVPEDYQSKYGKIRRHKPYNYEDNFIIKNPKGRNVHLFFGKFLADIELKIEHLNNNLFCLLFRDNRYRDLEKIIKKIESEPEFDFKK